MRLGGILFERIPPDLLISCLFLGLRSANVIIGHRRIVFFAAYALDPARDATLEHAQERRSARTSPERRTVARGARVSGDPKKDSG